MTASLARSNPRDITFNAADAYDAEALWSAGPLSQLVRSKVTLAGAALSPEGRLSLAAASRASREDWLPARSACESWPVTFGNWRALQTALQARLDPRLTGSAAMSCPVLLVPALHAKATFDAIAQEWIWGLADAAGSWIGLTLSVKERDAMAIARARRLSELGDVILVLAEARATGTRFTIEPVAAVARMPAGDHPEFINLDLETGGTELPGPAARLDWLARLHRYPMGAPPVPDVLAAARHAVPVMRLAAEALDVMLGQAELGTMRAPPEYRERVTGLARAAETIGLLALADALAAAAQDKSFAEPAALLRAVHIIERVQASTRQLPWLAAVGPRP